MNEYIANLLNTDGFPRRWECGTAWTPALGWFNIGSDLLVWSAYTAIPLVLAYFITRRKDIPFHGIFWLFATFILACGITHLMEAAIFWWPAYRFAGLLKFFTGAVSWLTVFALIKVTPGVLNLPGLAMVNARLQDEIQERKHVEQELVRYTQRLEQVNSDLVRANRELDEFTFIASHDLQEPVRKLIAYSGLLREDVGERLSEDAEEDVHFITDAAQRMQLLIQDLLQLSRTGRTSLELRTVALTECVQEALDRLELRIEETGAQIQIDDLPEVYGDPLMLTHLYQNLIANALKFTGKTAPRVHLTCERRGDQTILGVRDNGIGIEPKYADQIFAPFRRLHGIGEYAGSGIGLAICRKVVDRHEGEIWVESQPGEGAHFRFTLNLRPGTAASDPTVAESEAAPPEGARA